METVGIVLNVGTESVEAFERGFREHELPIWQDLQGRGVMVLATLNRHLGAAIPETPAGSPLPPAWVVYGKPDAAECAAAPSQRLP